MVSVENVLTGEWSKQYGYYVKVNGVWEPSQKIYYKKDGVWVPEKRTKFLLNTPDMDTQKDKVSLKIPFNTINSGMIKYTSDGTLWKQYIHGDSALTPSIVNWDSDFVFEDANLPFTIDIWYMMSSSSNNNSDMRLSIGVVNDMYGNIVSHGMEIKRIDNNGSPYFMVQGYTDTGSVAYQMNINIPQVIKNTWYLYSFMIYSDKISLHINGVPRGVAAMRSGDVGRGRKKVLLSLYSYTNIREIRITKGDIYEEYESFPLPTAPFSIN